MGKENRSTNTIGNISEAAITARLLQLGYAVFRPQGGKKRYDLVIEDKDGHFWRVQCKTAKIQDNGTVVAFDSANHPIVGKDRRWRPCRGQCEYFAAYCEKLNKVYLLLVDQVGTTRVHLRLVPAKNNQEKNVRWAKDYEI